MDYHASRFACPSLDLDLKGLVSKAQKRLWIALVWAVVVHLALTQLSGWREEQRVAKPLTTRFVKRQPRLTKPLEMKKRPRPKRRQMQRKMISVTAKAQREQATSEIQPSTVLGRLARPNVDVSRAVGLHATNMEPQAIAEMIEGEKEAKHIVDMSLEMLDVEAMDTGRYHALVIQDPSDKRNIKGFFRLKYAYSASQYGHAVGQDYRMIHALNSMIDAMNQYTDIKASYEGKLLFTSREMLKVPWVFCVISKPFVFSDEEANCLGKYLISGGFLLCDAVSPVEFYRGRTVTRIPVAITCARNNFKTAMATQGLEHGRDWTFEFLSNDHPLYHCYFDFDGSPASWYDTEMFLHGKLEGICIDGRWVLATCQKALVHIWGDPLNPQMREERMVQFGINTIIFALTQEGSITHRVMDEVR